MISKSEIPKEFGLIEVLESGQCSMSKMAKKLHDGKTTTDFALYVANNYLKKSV